MKAVVLILSKLSLAGCNARQCPGEDMQQGGSTLEKAAVQ